MNWPMAPVVCGIVSAVTFAAYGWDKFVARRAGVRISEQALHLLALCGGWPGALAGQMVFRHKTRKPAFRICFWLTVLINSAALYWYGEHLHDLLRSG